MTRFDKKDLGDAALLLVDLQNFIMHLPLAPHSGEEVVSRAGGLATAMRRAGRPVFYLKVDLSQILHGIVERPLFDPSGPVPPPEASDLVEGSGLAPSDTVVTKRHWGGFQSTELDLLLRRAGVKTLIIGGVATNFGVDSTARMAFDLGYNVVFAADAITGVDADLHRFAVEQVFPFMGRVVSCTDILAAAETAV